MAAELAPVVYGPTDLPEHTIGWTALDWCSRNLTNIDGQPWRFTPEQVRFVLWWYAIDENQRWLMRRGVLRRMKGWGKDPLAAILSVFEWIGPCRPAGWYRDGTPHCEPEHASWVQIAAATATQAEQNTMSLFPAIIPEGLREQQRLTVGIQMCWAPGRRRIQAVSNSSRGIEGARPTFVVMGETQHWVESNGGIRLADVISRNLTKSPGGAARSLAITNAHMDGEGSVAELDWLSRDLPDVLYDSIEAPADLDPDNRDDVVRGILTARGDAEWLDVDRVADDFLDPRTDTALNRRFFWNNIVAGSGKWMDPSAWAAAERTGNAPEEGALITLGFDGSRFRDATALVGTDLVTGWQWIVGLWERDWNNPNWEVPIDEVHAAVEEARKHWFVVRFYADPSWWEESISSWQATFTRPDGQPVVAAWYTGGGSIVRMARAVRAFLDGVEDTTCTHEPSPAFTRHVLAAHREPLKGRAGEDGLHVIRKPNRQSTESIDVAMGAVLSWQACLDARGAGDLELKRRSPGSRVAAKEAALMSYYRVASLAFGVVGVSAVLYVAFKFSTDVGILAAGVMTILIAADLARD